MNLEFMVKPKLILFDQQEKPNDLQLHQDKPYQKLYMITGGTVSLLVQIIGETIRMFRFLGSYQLFILFEYFILFLFKFIHVNI